MEPLTCQVCFGEPEDVKILACIHRICDRCAKVKKELDEEETASGHCLVSKICSGEGVLDGRSIDDIITERRLEITIIDDEIARRELEYVAELEDAEPWESEKELLQDLKPPFPKLSIASYTAGRNRIFNKWFRDHRLMMLYETKDYTRYLVLTREALRIITMSRFDTYRKDIDYLPTHEHLADDQIRDATMYSTPDSAKRIMLLVIPGARNVYRIGAKNNTIGVINRELPPEFKRLHGTIDDAALVLSDTAYQIYSTHRKVVVVDGPIVYCGSEYANPAAHMDATKIAKRLKYVRGSIKSIYSIAKAKYDTVADELHTRRKHCESAIDSLEMYTELAGSSPKQLAQLLCGSSAMVPRAFSKIIMNRIYEPTDRDRCFDAALALVHTGVCEWVGPMSMGHDYAAVRPICLLDGVAYAAFYGANRRRCFIQYYDPVTLAVQPRFDVLEETSAGAEAYSGPSGLYVYGVRDGKPMFAFEHDPVPKDSMIRVVDDVAYIEGRPLQLKPDTWFAIDFDSRDIVVFAKLMAGTVNGSRVRNRIPF